MTSLSVLVAVVPLLWVLYAVVSKGYKIVLDSTWWTNSQQGMTAFMAGGGVYHALVGTLLQGLVCAVISIPIGVHSAVRAGAFSEGPCP